MWLIRTHFFNLTSAAVRATRADKGAATATGATKEAVGSSGGSVRFNERDYEGRRQGAGAVEVVLSLVNGEVNEGCCHTHNMRIFVKSFPMKTLKTFHMNVIVVATVTECCSCCWI